MKIRPTHSIQSASIWFFGVLLLAGLLVMTGCESDHDDDEAGNTEDSSEIDDGRKDEKENRNLSSPDFPDGLHPSGSASKTIAKVFAGKIVGGDSSTVVVCVGDSITEGGYPGALGSITGYTVIDAGKAGEKSSGGAGRISSLLASHNPTHVCILYGINDLIHDASPNSVIGNLNAIVAEVKKAGATPIVGTLTPVFGSKYGKLQPAVDELNSKIRGIGAPIANLAGAF